MTKTKQIHVRADETTRKQWDILCDMLNITNRSEFIRNVIGEQYAKEILDDDELEEEHEDE